MKGTMMTIECKPTTSDYTCISKEIIRNKGIKDLNDIKTENLCSSCLCETAYLIEVELFTPADFNAWQCGYYID
tara:strand:+ start:102 stop:323 length:222 start_codon:yes stop_codon:yes gene_type:complete